MTISEMTGEIISDLTEELKDDGEFSENVLKSKVNSVLRELRMKRNYTATSMSEADIEEDMINYYSVIKDVSRYDYNQRGAEGEIGHSENGISRQYDTRDNLWKGVHAYVKVF